MSLVIVTPFTSRNYMIISIGCGNTTNILPGPVYIYCSTYRIYDKILELKYFEETKFGIINLDGSFLVLYSGLST